MLQGQIIKRGHFNRKAAERALVDHSAKSKEEVARWLRDELRVLRRPRVSAPVRNNISLSRLFISDVAITMLQFLKRAPGENLICLLQELLEVDRHRRKESEFQGETYAHALRVAALKSLQGVKFGVRDQARFVGVDPSTITRWRRSTGYSEGVQALKERYKKVLPHYIRNGKQQGLTESESFERAFTLLYLKDDFLARVSKLNSRRP